MSFTVERFEFYLCVMIRIASFIYTCPFFSLKNVPQRVKIGFSLSFAMLLFEALAPEPLVYATVVDFTVILLKEVLAGLIMGFFANASYHILALTGHILDMEIGFSMVSQFDQISGMQVTISSNLYSYSVIAVLVMTRMYLPILSAFAGSFEKVPVGTVFLNPLLYEGFLEFILEYFIIGFRIALPMFAAMLVVNAVLAVLARVAPQMNMFVVGIQLKVLVGFAVMIVMIGMLSYVSDYIYRHMEEMLSRAVNYLGPP